MLDLRNALNIECPRAKGGYLEEVPHEIWGNPDWFMEEKIDGERWTMQIGEERSMLVGRNRHDKLKGVEHAGNFVVQNARNKHLAAVKSKAWAGTILDGECTEVYKQNGEWDKTTQGRAAAGLFLGYRVWTVLFVKGVDVRHKPERLRRTIAERVVADLGSSRIEMTHVLPVTIGAIHHLFARGIEGAVLKKWNGTINPNARTMATWWKAKGDKNRTVDAFVIGATQGVEGGSGVLGIPPRPSGKTASLIVGMYTDSGYVIEVGKMFSLPDEAIEEGWATWPKYQRRVVEMNVSGWDGQAFRWPKFRRWREDKSPEDCLFSEQLGRSEKASHPSNHNKDESSS